MAHTKFPVEVLTPDGKVFDDEVEMVSTRTGIGSIGILANHTPLLAMLEPTELRLYQGENDVIRYAQGEGYLQVANGRVLVLVEEADEPDSLDTSDLQNRLEQAKERLSNAEEDSEDERIARRECRRWEAFLEIAEGGGGGS